MWKKLLFNQKSESNWKLKNEIVIEPDCVVEKNMKEIRSKRKYRTQL